MADHDHTYKILFSHAEMVGDLIRGFVHEEWVKDLDFSTLERVDATFITEELIERESDIIWRVRWSGERWLYVYLLIEFQSTVDPWMALRVMVYNGLLWQRLAKDGELTPSGLLPPVLPLVLYNGIRVWNAAQELAQLIETIPGLDRYRPQFRYCLLDEARMADEDLAPLRNLAAALFRLEKSRDAATIDEVLTSLLVWLKAPEQSLLRQAFATWIIEVLTQRLPGVSIPKLADLQEVKSMLAENITEWTRQWKQEGLEEGRQKERQEALEELREVLLLKIEERFGEVPESVRGKVAALNSYREIASLISRTANASSLATLGF